jgi:uncharacterized membrane protein
MLLNVLDGTARFSDLFDGFSDYGRILVPMLVLMAIFFVLGMIGNSVRLIGERADSLGLQGLGTLVNLVWTLAVTARLSFAMYYVVDQGLAPSEALQTSWQVTAPQKLTVAALIVITWVLALVGVLLLIVGIIPAMMIGALLGAAAYRQVAGRQSAAA